MSLNNDAFSVSQAPRSSVWHPPCPHCSSAETLSEKSKPVVRRGRKATGQAAAQPDSRATEGRALGRQEHGPPQGGHCLVQKTLGNLCICDRFGSERIVRV